MSHMDFVSEGAAPVLTFPHLGYILHLKHFAVILYSCSQSVLALKLQLINIQAVNSSANMCHVFWLWKMAQTRDVLSELPWVGAGPAAGRCSTFVELCLVSNRLARSALNHMQVLQSDFLRLMSQAC